MKNQNISQKSISYTQKNQNTLSFDKEQTRDTFQNENSMISNQDFQQEIIHKKIKLCDDFELSTKSLNTIEMIHQKKNNEELKNYQAEKKLNDIFQEKKQQKPNLKDKYFDLISLPLPKHYQQLVNLFECLDFTLQIMKTRKMVPFLSEIKKQIPNYVIDEDILKQIVFIDKQAYVLTWEFYEKLQQQQIYIEIDIPFDMNDYEKFFKERCKNFRNKITDFAKQQYKTWIIERGETFNDKFDLWHKDFKLNELKQIPKGELPVKKEQFKQNKPQQIQTFISGQNKDLQQQINEVKSVEKPQIVKSQFSKLSESLIQKIKEKERILKEQEEKQSQMFSKKFIDHKDQYKTITQIIKNYYSIRNVQNMFYVQVIDYLYNTKKNFTISKEQIQEIIKQLCEKTSYLKKIESQDGDILRINPLVSLSNLFQEINQKIM